jgi:phosphoglycolate phosphatase-like HAD superfamily hydrolase
LVDGAADVLAYLQERFVPCSIVSAHPVAEVLATVKRLEIGHHFRHIIGGIHEKKTTLSQVCESFGIAPREALFVGDLLSDVNDGNAAGLHTALYASPDYPHASLANYHVTHLSDIIPLLEEP